MPTVEAGLSRESQQSREIPGPALSSSRSLTVIGRRKEELCLVKIAFGGILLQSSLHPHTWLEKKGEAASKTGRSSPISFGHAATLNMAYDQGRKISIFS